MSNIITIKHGKDKPSTDNLSNFELGFCTGDGHLYINNNGAIVSTKSGTATVFPGEVIPSGADLNTYTTPGSYRSPSKEISSSLLNAPYTATGFKMEVFNTNSSNVFIQEIKCNSASARTYRRTGDKSSGVVEYGDWYKVMQSTTDALSVVSGGTGVSALTSGQVLIGNGTGAVTTRAIDTSAASGSTALITSGAVYTGLAGKLNTSGGTLTGDLTAPKLLVKQDGYVEPLKIFNAAGQVRTFFTISENDQFAIRTCKAGFSADAYRLPTPGENTTAGWHDILTTKKTVTVAQGGTNGTSAFAATNNLLALYLGNLTSTANDLAEKSNLDNITAGVYRSGTKEISATITNAPTTAAGFRLIASYLTTSSSFVQIAISYSTSVNIWVRIKTTSWGAWKKLTLA